MRITITGTFELIITTKLNPALIVHCLRYSPKPQAITINFAIISLYYCYYYFFFIFFLFLRFNFTFYNTDGGDLQYLTGAFNSSISSVIIEADDPDALPLSTQVLEDDDE